MKKFIQIALVVVLVCLVFQSVALVSLSTASDAGSSTVSNTLTSDESSEYAAVCMFGLRKVPCAIQNVGWNT